MDELESIDFGRVASVATDRTKVVECISASADIIFDILERLFSANVSSLVLLSSVYSRFIKSYSHPLFIGADSICLSAGRFAVEGICSSGG